MLFIKLFLWGGSSLCLVEAQYYAREPAHLKYFEDFAQSKGMPHPGFPHSYEAKLEYPAPEFDHPINHPPNTIASQDPPLAIMENSLWTSAVNASMLIPPSCWQSKFNWSLLSLVHITNQSVCRSGVNPLQLVTSSRESRESCFSRWFPQRHSSCHCTNRVQERHPASSGS